MNLLQNLDLSGSYDQTIASHRGKVVQRMVFDYGGVMQKVPENSHRLMPRRQGSAVTQTTNFRDRPRAALDGF
jgi:hypothetical protein